jgi:hypothetical protein
MFWGTSCEKSPGATWYLMIQKHMHNCSFQFRQKNQESALLQTAPNVLKKKQLHFQIFY